MDGMTSLIEQGENPDLARGLVLLDTAPRIETRCSAEMVVFMRTDLEGVASLDDAATAIAAYTRPGCVGTSHGQTRV